jgi:hypothetical protein
MKQKYLIVLLLIILIPSLAEAQRWKRQRWEFSFGAGVTNFLGELGGANQIGTNYFKDLEWSMTRFATSVGLRYKLSNYFALKSNLTYGRVAGDDKLTTEKFRNHRNINFRSDVVEVNMNFEGAFQQEQVGHRYRLRKVRGLKGYELYLYGFVGVGVFYFNPVAEYDGKVYQLRNLGTEGQGITPTREKYSQIQVCVPVGFGFKYTIDRSWGVGIELGIRKTFTDYIDDVSTTYFDFASYPGEYDPDVLIPADPSLPTTDSGLINATAAGEQRGDPRDKDSYMFAIFSVNYKIKRGRGSLPRF